MSDFAQEHLIKKIKTYLLTHGREQTAENLSPGYCAGLTVLFLYLASTSRLDLLKQLLTHLDEWSPEPETIIAERIAKLKLSPAWKSAEKKLSHYLQQFPVKNNLSHHRQLDDAEAAAAITKEDALILRQAMLPDDPSIEKLFGLIDWVQQHALYQDIELSAYADKAVIDVIHDEKDPHAFEKKIYANSLILDCAELAKVIENIPEECPVFLSSFDHAFAVYKTASKKYILYESNHTSLSDPTSSAKEIADKLIRDTYLAGYIGDKTKFTQSLPLNISITSRHHQDTKIIDCLSETINEITMSKPLNQRAYDGSTAVLLAAKTQQTNTLAALIERGENVNISHHCGLYPIHLASQIQVMEKLLDAGAWINQPIMTSDASLKLLHYRTILYYRSLEGATPLYVLAGYGSPEALEWMIQHKAAVNGVSAIGLSPLMHAAKEGKLNNVKLLIAHGANTALTVKKLDTQVTEDGRDSYESMLSHVAGGILGNSYEGYNAAMFAAANKHTDVVIEMIDYKINVHHKANDGFSLLTLAVKNGDTRLLKKLIEHGVSLTDTVATRLGKTSPLGLACHHGHMACAEMLIAAGASVRRNHPDDIPPLLEACFSNNPDIIQLLLQHGADFEEEFQGFTPLAYAIQWKNPAATAFLMQAGAKLTEDQVDFDTLIELDQSPMLALVLQHLHLSNEKQRSLLKNAINRSKLQCVQLLLKNNELLSNKIYAIEFIKHSLQTKGDPRSLAELMTHCLLVQKHDIDFDKIQNGIFHMPLYSPYTFSYFKHASAGKQLDEILNILIDDLPFSNANNQVILHEAVKEANSIENLLTILTAKAKYVDRIDESTCEMLYSVIKDVIYQYPLDRQQDNIHSSQSHSHDK